MVYLFTALYCEAYIFIKQFHLEKDLQNTRFQVFYNREKEIRLTVTGVGGIAAATAVGSICTEYKPKGGDVLLNIGTCAHIAGSGGIFLCNKITEWPTGKVFYPDILYRHNFCEETIVTGMMPWNGEENIMGIPLMDFDAKLYDMEAAAIYQAGSYFFGPHQMMFLKVVSDGGTPEVVSKEGVEHLMEGYQEVLFSFTEQLRTIIHENKRMDNGLWKENEGLFEKLCTDLHCSKVMRDSLRQHLQYLILTGTDYESVVQDMYLGGLLPCKDKREGKLRFEELRRRLF